jgi:hypothetical protein
LMTLCPGIKRDGGRCTVTVEPPQTHCWWHDPANAEARRRAASRAGKSKPNRELSEIKDLLKDLTSRVLKVEGYAALETAPAAIANQLLNTRLRAIEQERKIRETEDLEARIEALERASEAKKGGPRCRGA